MLRQWKQRLGDLARLVVTTLLMSALLVVAVIHNALSGKPITASSSSSSSSSSSRRSRRTPVTQEAKKQPGSIASAAPELLAGCLEHSSGSLSTSSTGSDLSSSGEGFSSTAAADADAAPQGRPQVHSNPHGEKAIRDVVYYSKRLNYVCEEHRVVTKDGFVLQLHRIISVTVKNTRSRRKSQPAVAVPRRTSVAQALGAENAAATMRAGAAEAVTAEDQGSAQPQQLNKHPVLLQHGLFMSSGIFVANEESSLAFFLLERGYDVWLGNNRGVIMEHERLSTKDPKFWDWSVDDLAKYDVPAIVDHVLQATGRSQLTWIGHSQGNAQAFMALSTNKELSSKISLLVALAPTARLGELPTRTLKALRRPETFELFFGDKQFVPMINSAMVFAPPQVFAALAYNVFYFLFNWSDTRWVKTRKPKYFQFCGLPVSCKQIRHWMKMTELRGLSEYETGKMYPLENIEIPLAVFHGEKDDIVDAKSLIEFFEQHPTLQLRRFERIPEYEHLDLVWANDCHYKVFEKLDYLIHQEIDRP